MYKLKKYGVLIVAGGVGTRCNTNIPKQYINMNNHSIIFNVIQKFLLSPYIDCIRVVIHRDHNNFYKKAVSSITSTKLLDPMCGGENRQNSVLSGIESLNTDYVIIHDACRPFLSLSLIERLIKSTNENYIGFVPVIEVENTISLVNGGIIESTLRREKIKVVQTPQLFNLKKLLSCYQSTKEIFTDDSSLAIAQGEHVATIQGEKSNLKLTTKEDIDMAILAPKFRVGIGYDVHRFIKTQMQSIKICGVDVDHNMSIDAHSDGDVAIHAIVDAILGALGCGDIGEHFPPDSPQWKNCDSSYFLYFAAEKAEQKGYKISNLDITLVCEEPKILPYKTKMKESIAKLLKINDESINVKATTTEKLGSIGRKEGIAAHAVVLLYQV